MPNTPIAELRYIAENGIGVAYYLVSRCGDGAGFDLNVAPNDHFLKVIAAYGYSPSLSKEIACAPANITQVVMNDAALDQYQATFVMVFGMAQAPDS